MNGIELNQIEAAPKYATIEMPQDVDGRFIDMGREGPEWEQIEDHIRNGAAAVIGNYAEVGGVGN